MSDRSNVNIALDHSDSQQTFWMLSDRNGIKSYSKWELTAMSVLIVPVCILPSILSKSYTRFSFNNARFSVRGSFRESKWLLSLDKVRKVTCRDVPLLVKSKGESRYCEWLLSLHFDSRNNPLGITPIEESSEQFRFIPFALELRPNFIGIQGTSCLLFQIKNKQMFCKSYLIFYAILLDPMCEFSPFSKSNQS